MQKLNDQSDKIISVSHSFIERPKLEFASNKQTSLNSGKEKRRIFKIDVGEMSQEHLQAYIETLQSSFY
jgi:hypothetical protein